MEEIEIEIKTAQSRSGKGRQEIPVNSGIPREEGRVDVQGLQSLIRKTRRYRVHSKGHRRH